jgi:hypothetical protein
VSARPDREVEHPAEAVFAEARCGTGDLVVLLGDRTYATISSPRSAVHLSVASAGSSIAHHSRSFVAREPDGVVIAEVGAVPGGEQRCDA